MNITKEQDLSNNLLDYFLAHGSAACAARFHVDPKWVRQVMREVGVPMRRQGQRITPNATSAKPPAESRPLKVGGKLTDEARAALRAEFVPGKRGENTRLARKYGIATPSVTYLTKHLRPA